MNPITAKIGLCFGMMLPAEGVGMREQWKPVYEETLTTQASTVYRFPLAYKSSSALNDVLPGEKVRLTVNGATREFTVWTNNPSDADSSRFIGNAYLTTGAGQYDDEFEYGEDSGFDFCVTILSDFNMITLHSRSAGTYTVKVERVVNYYGI